MNRNLSSLLLISTIVLISACARNAPYHPLDWTPQNCMEGIRSESCTQSYYQEYPNYDLAFAEYSERGNAFNDRYITKILNKIRNHSEKQGVVVLTFVHGWKNNAHEDNENLRDFKKTLEIIAGNKHRGRSILSGRKLVGLYIGWRGASSLIPGIQQLTFWDRKSVAEEIGRGGITQLLLELSKITQPKARDVLSIFGHSFGGAIVLSSLSEVLAERVIYRTENNYAANIADAIVVLNPAIEANQSLHLVEAAIKDKYKVDQRPIFISISTDSDWATHIFFPLGQHLGTSLTWKQLDLQRSHYFDRRNTGDEGDNVIPVLKEEYLDTTTVGNFAPYLTHRLEFVDSEQGPTFVYKSCKEVPAQCIPKGWTSLSGQPYIGPLPGHYPLYFIKTGKRVMNGHGDIFNKEIRSFLLAVINDIVLNTIYSNDRNKPTLLDQPERLVQQSNAFYRILSDLEKSQSRANNTVLE